MSTIHRAVTTTYDSKGKVTSLQIVTKPGPISVTQHPNGVTLRRA